jgi:hypothetical protein
MKGAEPAFLTRVRSEVVEMGVDTRRATEGHMPISAAAVEGW